MNTFREALSYITSYTSTNGSTTNIAKCQHPAEDCYEMEYERRGCAIIFNHIPEDTDKKNIQRTLNKLEFDVIIYDNLNFKEIVDIVNQVSKHDHSDAACLVIVLITHGCAKGVQAADIVYNPDELWKPFSASKCPSLIGKPKLFFIDACLGTIPDKGVRVQFDNGQKAGGKIPNMADFLIMYSTQPDHKGFANPKVGSWFIHALCAELEKRHESQDLLSILTFVNRRIAFQHEGVDFKNIGLDGAKQVSSIVSNLTRYLHLN